MEDQVVKGPAEGRQLLPSAFQPGDFGIRVRIPGQANLNYGRITKVSFSESKVWYDVEFNWLGDEEDRHYVRLHNVDSAFLEDMKWEPSVGENGEYDQRYKKNSRGRWEMKEEFKD